MVGKVSSLMKTVRNVEDEAARGVQSLEATIDSIENELRVNIPHINVHVYVLFHTCMYRKKIESLTLFYVHYF